MLSLTPRTTLRLAPALLRRYSTVPSAPVRISVADSGIKVATFDESAPAVSLAVVVNGGSRAETSETEGLAHFLKNWGFQNNQCRTAFRITREAEILGGVLSSSLGRENITYSAEFLLGDAEYFAETLSDVVSQTKFQDHEFAAIAERVQIESTYASSDAAIVALDAAHAVAFRTGLGNSLFAGPTTRASASAVKSFAAQVFLSSNLALVGTGIPHEELTSYVSKFFDVPTGAMTNLPSKYYGGEQRISAEGGDDVFLLAYSSPAVSSPDYAAAQVLKYVLGGEKYLKRTTGASPLALAASKVGGGAQLASFNLAYSDAGLFGVLASAPSADHVGQAAAAAVEQLRAATKGIRTEDLKRAVAQAKFAAASSIETRADRLQNLGTAAFAGKFISPTELAAQFDSVEAGDVVKAATKIFSTKLTTVAVGEIRALPFADSISL